MMKVSKLKEVMAIIHLFKKPLIVFNLKLFSKLSVAAQSIVGLC